MFVAHMFPEQTFHVKDPHTDKRCHTPQAG